MPLRAATAETASPSNVIALSKFDAGVNATVVEDGGEIKVSGQHDISCGQVGTF